VVVKPEASEVDSPTPLDDEDSPVAARKPRPSGGHDSRLEPPCAIKMLVPSVWAGCLIGKGEGADVAVVSGPGETAYDWLLMHLYGAARMSSTSSTGGATINELQERTGARIKLSQNNDFYPGLSPTLLGMLPTRTYTRAALPRDVA
jgi:hypothetical protein